MAKKKTIAAFGEWVKDPANVDDVLRRVLEGAKVEKIALAIKQPYTLLWPHLHSTPELKARFDAARKGRADALVEKALTVVDAVPAVKEAVAKAKLQADTYLGVAAKWDRDRYGDKQEVNVNVAQWVMRLPEPAADSAAWQKSIGRVFENAKLPAQTPALNAPSGANEPLGVAPADATPA